MKRSVLLGLALLCCLYPVSLRSAHVYADAPKIIKFATLAPEGSTWAKVIHDIDKELQEKSGGRLQLKIYAGGVSGDERDVIRKMRIGQLHCAGFTGVGLGDILPDVRIFDMPFFFKDYEEVDFIRDIFKDRFSRAFEEKNYVLLGWSEVGFVYFFSTNRIDTIESLRSAKMWVWETDPLANNFFSALKLSLFPLSIVDVMTSLQTGLINGVYASPLAAIAFQWFTKVKYMLDLPIADATGAVLIQKKYYDDLSPDLQEILRDTFKGHMDRLTPVTRDENRRSVGILKENGVKVISLDDEKSIRGFEDAGKKAVESIAETAFPLGLIKDITAEIERYREGKKGKASDR